MMKSSTIVGYTFNADNYCVTCTRSKFPNHAHGPVSAENVLDRAAIDAGVNRNDERSFDSSEFPKVIFADQVESADERCGDCGDSLLG